MSPILGSHLQITVNTPDNFTDLSNSGVEKVGAEEEKKKIVGIEETFTGGEKVQIIVSLN